jgi:hypothetical protein
MGWNWQMYETQWKRKRKNSDNKRMFRDCDLIKQDDGSFNIYWAYNIWERDEVTGKVKTVRGKRKPLAHITQDNVLTITFDQIPCLTSMKRLRYIIGLEVYGDSAHHKTSVHKTRVSATAWCGRHQTPMPWSPSTDSWRANIPFSTGMQFRMDSNGHPTELLKVEEDIKVLVKPEAIQQAKADTKIIRLLLRGMVRLGAFDHHIDERIDRKWSVDQPKRTPLKDVNYKVPMGSDAEAIFLLGLDKANVPDRSTYVGNQWVQRKPEEVRAIFIDNALEHGMKLLRRHIYETTDGLERVTV